MAKKGNLFKLIKSLSKAEKRYFKMFLNNGGSNKNYLRLFDFIDNQEALDDDSIKKHFKGETFLKQLHVTKNYLMSLIMKSLRNFHDRNSKNAALKDLLRDIEILYKRELYDQCHYAIVKAQKLALEYEKLGELLETYRWQRTIIQHQLGPVESRVLISSILGKELKVIEQLKRQNEYFSLTYDLMNNISNQTYWSEVLGLSLLKDPSKANSMQSRIFYYHLHYILNTFLGEPMTGVEAIDTLISILEDNPKRIKEEPDSYITALNNKMGALLQFGDTEATILILQKIRNIPDKYNLRKDERSVLKLFIRTYNVELELYRDLEQWNKGVNVIDEIRAFLEENEKSIADNYLASFYYQFSYIYFMKEDYSKALKDLNKIVAEGHWQGREDIMSFARILNLIIHFELKNIMVLKYAVDATRRFLMKKRQLHHYEQVLLKFFSKLSTSPKSQYHDLFKQLQIDLFSKTTEDQKRSALDYLNFEKWINKKTIRTSIY
ncbi:MAG: hypothetical protein AAFX87_28350 [Bacteroidota bacterium]